MDSQIINRTALSDFKPVAGEHSLIEALLNGKINLRGNPDNTEFTQAIENTLGLALPREANTISASAGLRIFWLGPDEWLIHLPLKSVEEKIQISLPKLMVKLQYVIIRIVFLRNQKLLKNHFSL